MRYVLTLEYKGTNFSGSQKQKSDKRTVQGELEKALSTLTKNIQRQSSQAEQMQEYMQEVRLYILIQK